MLQNTKTAEQGASAQFDRKVHEAARRKLQSLIKKAEKQDWPLAEWVEIGPEFANLLLERNPDNRAIKPILLETIVSDMMSGRWEPYTGETIIVAKDGCLNDGQHRLTALAQSGMTYPFLFVFGVERDMRVNLDLGRARNAGDFITMNKIKDGNNVAAVASMLIAYEEGKFDTGYGARGVFRSRTTNSRTKQFQYAMEHLEAIQQSLTVARRRYNMRKRVASISRLAGAHRIIAQASGDVNSVNQFFLEINTGAATVLDGNNKRIPKSRGVTPISVARARLMESRLEKLSPFQVLSVLVRAWNAWRTGNQIGRLTHQTSLPEIAK